MLDNNSVAQQVGAILRGPMDWLRDRSVLPRKVQPGTAGQVLTTSVDIAGQRTAAWALPGAGMALVHDHARPAWSATVVRTTSLVVPAGANALLLQLQCSHANASGIWDTHIWVGTTSGGSELLSIAGTSGWVGVGSGTGTPYPFCGAWVIPLTTAMRGSTVFVTSSAPAGNYYLAADIKVYADNLS